MIRVSGAPPSEFARPPTDTTETDRSQFFSITYVGHNSKRRIERGKQNIKYMVIMIGMEHIGKRYEGYNNRSCASTILIHTYITGALLA